MSYATSGLGATAPAPAGVSVPARTLQGVLNNLDCIGCGFSVGTVDGIFGPNSQRALQAALAFYSQPTAFTVSSDLRSVRLGASAYATLAKHSTAQADVVVDGQRFSPTSTTTTPRTSPSPSPDTSTPPGPGADVGAGGGADMTPWLIGGGVLLAGIGGYLLLSSPKGASVRVSVTKRYTKAKRKAKAYRRLRKMRRTKRNSRRSTKGGTKRRGTRRNSYNSPRRVSGNPSKSDRVEFRDFCRNASDRQLYGILEKEREGAERDPDREVYAEICEAEMERRGLSTPNRRRGTRPNRLSDARRARMPKSAFVFPARRAWPIDTPERAFDAIRAMRLGRVASAADYRKIRKTIRKRYPSVWRDYSKGLSWSKVKRAKMRSISHHRKAA